MRGAEADQHDFSENKEGGHFRRGSNKGGGRNGRALIGIGRPEVKWRGGDLKSEADQRHDNAGGQKRCHGPSLVAIDGETGRARHSVNEADAKKREGAGGAAEEKIFQAGFGGADVGLVEGRHDVEGQAGEFEADKNHEELFAADEEHQPNGGEQEQSEIFAVMPGSAVRARELR